jgi:hypothetical protein
MRYLALVCLALAPMALAQVSDEALALQFYPEKLRVDEQKFSSEPLPPLFEAVRGDLTGSGSDFLVVAYSNGRMGALRVIDVHGPRLVDEDLTITGSNPHVELFDLDRDGRMEIIAAFAAMRTDTTSIYKWTSSRLDLWGPTRTDQYGVERSALPSLDYADLDGDGFLELIEPKDVESGMLVETVYHLSGGQYVLANSSVFHGEYVRGTGEPETIRSSFPVPNGGAGKWVLRVVNGDDKGAKTVTAGDIRVNGVSLITTDRLKQKVRTISVPVTLGADNTIEVQLRGSPNTGLTVSVSKE